MDPKPIAEKSLKSACRVFLNDLQSLPEEAFSKSFGGKARTVADIVYEVNMVNDDLNRVICGEKESDWPEGWITAPPELQAKDAVIKSFEESSQRLISTAERLDAAAMEAPLQTEQGETNAFERFRFAALHLWYHSGQLNFMQTLLGDDVWHWNQ
jgi:hypothetical protein